MKGYGIFCRLTIKNASSHFSSCQRNWKLTRHGSRLLSSLQRTEGSGRGGRGQKSGLGNCFSALMSLQPEPLLDPKGITRQARSTPSGLETGIKGDCTCMTEACRVFNIASVRTQQCFIVVSCFFSSFVKTTTKREVGR